MVLVVMLIMNTLIALLLLLVVYLHLGELHQVCAQTITDGLKTLAQMKYNSLSQELKPVDQRKKEGLQ